MLAGFWCPVCTKDVGLDHFVKECPAPPMPRAWGQLLYEHAKPRKLGKTHCTSPTAVLGCVRQWFLERFFDHRINPTRDFHLHLGTILHRELARATVRGSLGPAELRLEHVEIPIIQGYLGKMNMVIDAIEDYNTTIIEYKLTSITQIKKLPRNSPRPLHNAQVVFEKFGLDTLPADYRVPDPFLKIRMNKDNQLEMVDYVEPKKVDIKAGTVWYIANMAPFDLDYYESPWVPKQVEFGTAEELLDFIPLEGAASIMTMGKALRTALDAVEIGVDPSRAVDIIPCFGLDMMKEDGVSGKCTKFCGVNHLCKKYGGPPEVMGNIDGQRERNLLDIFLDGGS